MSTHETDNEMQDTTGTEISPMDVSQTPMDENLLDFGDDHIEETRIEKPTEEKSEDAPEEETSRLPPPEPAPTAVNTLLEHPVYEALPAKVDENFAIILVPKRISRIGNLVKQWGLTKEEQEDDEITEHSEKWLEGVGINMTSSFIKDKGYFERTLDNQDAFWVQELKHEDSVISFRAPNIRDSGKPRNVTGFAAKDLVTSILGLGISNRIGLPGTGLQMVIGARGDGDLLNLDIALAYDKANFGHETSGLIFQNSNYALVEKVSKFIFDSVRSVNLQNWQDIDLGDIVRVTDLPLLYWGQGTTIFPNGFPLELPCSSNPAECRHIETVNANVSRLAWYNRNGLSTEQLAQLGREKHLHTLEEVEEYQKKSRNLTRVIPIGYDMKLHLRVPTINEFIDSGRKFVKDASQALEKIMIDREMDENNKRNFVRSHIALSSIREYGHWIEKLVVRENTTIIERNALDDILGTLSAKGDIVEKVFSEIQMFIEDCTVAVIAVPNFSCPKCGQDYSTDENSKHPELVPINPLKLFFELKDRRLMRRDPSQTN